MLQYVIQVSGTELEKSKKTFQKIDSLCPSYKTQNIVKLQKKMTFSNKLDCFLIEKIFTCIISALAQHCKITESIL